MKMSEWLREYQLTGKVPDAGGSAASEGGTVMAFWAGWLIGPSHTLLETTSDERLEMATKAAEFIEERAQG